MFDLYVKGGFNDSHLVNVKYLGLKNSQEAAMYDK